MNQQPSHPRAATRLLRKTLLGTALFLSLGMAARAEKFFLAAEEGGIRYGPFEYQEGAKVALGDHAFAIEKEQAPGETDLEKKLQAIPIDLLSLHEAKLQMVVNFLVESCRKNAPQGQPPINMILNLKGKPEEQLPLITFSARQITVLEALKVVTQVAGMTYRIDGNIVFIEP